MKMSQNNDYTRGNLLDFPYHEKFYKRIGIDLSRQKNMSVPQQIDLTAKLEEDDGAITFFIGKNNKKLF